MIEIHIANRQRKKRVDAKLLERIVRAVLQRMAPAAKGALGLHLIGAKTMARLNWRFLRHEGSTDVITFDHSDRLDPYALEGEIFVSIDDAIAQATAFRTSWQSEIVRYIVHGLLHLRGHDDHHPARWKTMKRAENALVRSLHSRFEFESLSGRHAPRNRALARRQTRG